MISDAIDKFIPWIIHYGFLLFIGFFLIRIAIDIIWGLAVGEKARIRFIQNYIQSRGYHLLNAELPSLLDLPTLKLAQALSGPSTQRGTDGITDIKEFQQRSPYEILAFYCNVPSGKMTIFGHSYISGTASHSSVHMLKVAKLSCEETIPLFRLEKRGIVTKVETLVTKILDAKGIPVPFHEVDFSIHPAFSKAHFLSAQNEPEVRTYFTDQKIAAFEQVSMQGQVATNAHHIVYFESGKFSDESSYDAFVSRAQNIMSCLVKPLAN